MSTSSFQSQSSFLHSQKPFSSFSKSISSFSFSWTPIPNLLSEKCKRAKQPTKLRSRQRAKLRKRESEAEAASINEANQFLSFWRPVEPFQPEIAPDTKPEITPEPVIELQVHETDQEPEPVPVPKYEPYWRNKSGLSIWNEGRNRNDRHNAWYLPCLRDFEMIILGIFRVQLY